MKLYVNFLVFVFYLSCTNKSANQADKKITTTEIKLAYAAGFKISNYEGEKLVEVTYPFQGATAGYKYLLVQRGHAVPKHAQDIKVITIPLTSIVCTSTTHLPFLDYLEETDKLIGFPSTHYISSVKMRRRVDKGDVTELGVDKGMNLEKLVMLKPDVVMGYTATSDYGQFKKIEELGIPVVINAEYLEKHPLGRAEWIKFMALFFNKEKAADSIFVAIEKRYQEVKTMAQHVQKKPTVLTGILYGDTWFLPGGKNYSATMLDDAGYQYLWKDDNSNGFLQLSLETVYEKANNADFWIGVGTYRSLAEIENSDLRYKNFKAFKTKKVYTYNGRTGPTGGSEFMELGYLRPDIILKDLVKISQPDLLPDYVLYFHKRLE